MPVAADSAVEFEDVCVSLAGVRILEHVRARVPRGSATAIIGPNGAGKTTLLLAMLGQVPHEGRIRMHAPGGGEPRIGYVPQSLDFDRGMPLTVMDVMTMGRQRRPLWLGARAGVAAEALALLERVKAEHLARRRLGALSGGALQRVLLALAIQQNPDVLILDEPSSGVDVAGEYLLCELLVALRAEKGFTQIMVTHDLSMVTAHAEYVVCLNRRVLGEGETSTVLTARVLAATFGLHLGLADLHAMSGITSDHTCTAPDHDHEHPREGGHD